MDERFYSVNFPTNSAFFALVDTVRGMSSVGRFSVVAPALALLLTAGISWASPATVSPQQGYDRGEFATTRAMAMGGAANALGVSTTGLFLNPANLPFARVYHIEANGMLSPEARRQTFGGAIVDSVLNRLGLSAGFAASWSTQDPDGVKRTWSDLRLSLAIPLGDRFALGATGRYLRAEQAVGKGPFGASLASDGTPTGTVVNAPTFDLGLTAAFTKELRLGVVGHNLTNPGHSLLPTTLAGGLGYGSREFSVEAGAHIDFTTFGKPKVRAMFGAEVFLADRIAVRGGYSYDDGFGTQAVSAGLGYIDRKWSVELSGKRDVAGQLQATQSVLSLRYFYDAVGINDEPDPQSASIRPIPNAKIVARSSNREGGLERR
jgi:hypothetical protein